MGDLKAASINSSLSKYGILLPNLTVFLVSQLDMLMKKRVKISDFFQTKIVTGSFAERRIVTMSTT